MPSSRLQYNLSHTRVKALVPVVDVCRATAHENRTSAASGLVFIVIAAMFGLFHLAR